MKLASWKNGFIALLAVIGVTLLAGCFETNNGGGNNAAQQAALDKAAHNQVYQQKNAVELNNYNARQKIADDPTTILWCTGAFPIPSSPLFTVPILGKLTSASKRPFSTSQVVFTDSTNLNYSPELPGPDGMYGPSDTYRYGFTPGGVYVEFSGSMETFCTTQATVWQRQNTTIVVATDDKLTKASQGCQALLPKPPAVPTADELAQCQALIAAGVGK
jgi:hypothetical protein